MDRNNWLICFNCWFAFVSTLSMGMRISSKTMGGNANQRLNKLQWSGIETKQCNSEKYELPELGLLNHMMISNNGWQQLVDLLQLLICVCVNTYNAYEDHFPRLWVVRQINDSTIYNDQALKQNNAIVRITWISFA